MKEYYNNNQYFQQLLEIFTRGYIPIYNKRKVVARKEINQYLSRNFNVWYYSQTLSEDVSPACFVNSCTHNEVNTKSIAFPLCRPIFSRDRIIEISYTFRVFTLDNHPFLQDMQSFFQAKGNTRISNDGLAYRETLIEVCERLSLHTVSMNNGTLKILRQEENIKAFFALPNNVKLNRVIEAMINRFLDALAKVPLPDKRPVAKDIHTALKNGKMLKKFLTDLFGNLNKSVDDKSFNNKTVNGKPINIFKKTSEAQLFSICCTYFFIPFGQYLQLIQPEYKDIFEFTSNDDEYLEAVEKHADDIEAKKQEIYMSPPDGYNITPLSAEFFGFEFCPYNQPFPLLPQGNHQSVLNGMVEELDRYEEAEMKPKSLGVDPLKGLNPEDLPICTNERVNYTFKVRRKTIIIKGSDTLADFANVIHHTFSLSGTHSSSFFMGAKVFETKHEISVVLSHLESFSNVEDVESEALPHATDFRIHQLGLYVQQKFSYLYDFDTEQKFSITFVGTS